MCHGGWLSRGWLLRCWLGGWRTGSTRRNGKNCVCSAWRRESLREDLTAACKSLMGGWREDVVRLFLEVNSNGARGNRHRLEHSKLQLDIKKLFYQEEQVAPRGCGLPSFQGVKGLIGFVLGKPGKISPALSRGLGWMLVEVPFNLNYSVIQCEKWPNDNSQRNRVEGCFPSWQGNIWMKRSVVLVSECQCPSQQLHIARNKYKHL